MRNLSKYYNRQALPIALSTFFIFLSGCTANPTSSVTAANSTKVCTVTEPVIGSNFSKHKPCRETTKEERILHEQEIQQMRDSMNLGNLSAPKGG